MKRIITLSLIMCCLLLTACDNASIGVIGGADGPTAAFIATSAVAKAGMAVVAVIVVLCIAAAVIFIRKNKNK